MSISVSNETLSRLGLLNSCGVYSPVTPAKYRILGGKRHRLYRCRGCGESKWYEVAKRKGKPRP